MKFAAKKIIPFPGPRNSRNKDELEFLPAALEIVETPASPLGRAIGLIVILLFAAALAWAYFGEVDIIASAHGKIIPSGRTKVIQPFETSVVRAIHVHDGQAVKAGDVLIELDSTMSEAERGQLRNDLMAARLDVARLKAVLAATTDSPAGDIDPRSEFHPPEGADADTLATQQRLLLDQIAEYRAKLASLERQQAEKEAERATTSATIEKIEASIPIMDQRVEIRKTLFEHNTGSKWNYLEILQAATEQKHELKVQQNHFKQAEAAIAGIAATRAQARAEFGRTRSSELAEAQRKAGGLGQALLKAEERVRLQALTASVNGVVQQLAVHTVGGVVTPAQTLLVIVPQESHLEIEAMVSNQDIGFVHPGQPAEIKVDTFNFTRYGLLHGQVLSVSQDAIVEDKQSDPKGRDDQIREPKGRELNYAARVSLNRTQMEVENKLVDLSPGMAVTVEIKTGKRRILSYLLSPLLRYKHDSLRER